MSVKASDSGPSDKRPRILVVDDDPALARVIGRMISDRYDTIIVVDARQAVELVAGGDRFDLILCDLMMPELSGMDFYDKVVEIDAPTAERILFLTGGAVTRRATEFLRGGARPYLEKPFDRAALVAAIQRLLPR